MMRTASLNEPELLFRQFLCHIRAQIRIRNKENLVIFEISAHFDSTRRSDANIRKCLELSRRIHIRHHAVVRKLFL